MESQEQPNKDIRIPLSSEERLSNRTQDALDLVNKFIEIAAGLEEYTLTNLELEFKDKASLVLCNRRFRALNKAYYALMNVIRIVLPYVRQIGADKEVDNLKEMRGDIMEAINQINLSKRTRKKTDDLIWEYEDNSGKYSTYSYATSPNFDKFFGILEEMYDDLYSILLSNNILTKPKNKVEERKKQHEIF